jgi:hypothetical protein
MWPLMHGTPVKNRFSPRRTAVSLLIFLIENRPYLICGDSQRQIDNRAQEKAPANHALNRICALRFCGSEFLTLTRGPLASP